MAISSQRVKLIFRKTDRDLARLSASQQPNRVHGFRTTARRLQTLLEEIMPERDRNQKKLLKVLDRLRRRAGKIRDIDVQLAALRSLKVPQEPRRKTQLTQSLLELRAKHETRLDKLLSKSDLQEIRRRLKRAFKTVDFESAQDALTVAKKMLGSVAVPAGPASEDTLHQYRIVVKRARYAAEFASKSNEGGQLLAQLKGLQDALGNWHDWMTLTRTAVDRFGDVSQSSLVAALNNVTGAKFRHAVTAVSAVSVEKTIHGSGRPAFGVADPARKVTAKRPDPVSRTETAA
jgi:CHAD domain-containing protein